MGRKIGSKNKPKTNKPVDWEKLAKDLQQALAKEIKENQALQLHNQMLMEESAQITNAFRDKNAVINYLENIIQRMYR